MNIPYVKKFDKNGVCINPIKGFYANPYPNRKQRRKEKQEINKKFGK